MAEIVIWRSDQVSFIKWWTQLVVDGYGTNLENAVFECFAIYEVFL